MFTERAISYFDDMYTLVLLFTYPLLIHGLIGYDCGSRQLNVTTLSLLDVADCDIPETPVNVTRTYVQLLQINDYSETLVRQCKLEVHRTVYYCGMHSHISIVLNGENDFVAEISQKACDDLHLTGVLRLENNHVIHGVRVNKTVSHGIIFAGYVNGEGKCNGAGYTDPFGTWESVVVQGTIKITLTEYPARVKMDNNQIYLQSGTTCVLSDMSCVDIEGGYTFWNSVPMDSCKFQQYSVLYEGYANRIIDFDVSHKEYIYSLSTQDISFALTSKGKETVCGYTIIKTEHPKLLIFETSKGDTFATRNKISVSNLDIFAYVNSKFVYVEKHIRSQMKQLYRDVILQRCTLERQTLKNSLSIATQAPDNFAYDLMKGPGYMALIAGEVVHIIKCVPVEVKIKHGDYCYAELEVTRSNQTYYLTPRTHILKTKGTLTTCNPLLPAYYSVGSTWYKILPRPTEAIPPIVIHPMTKSTWVYKNPADLATTGIYTEKDLDQLREKIMFPVERPALLNDLAREMRGHPLINNEGTILKLLNEDAVEKIVEGAWSRAWRRFVTFGTASAGVIAILLIIRTIKVIIDMVIQGYALHSIYGWSIHLLGALWSSVTYLLIHLRRQRPEESNTGGVELMEVQVTPSASEGTKPVTSTATNQTDDSSKTEKPFFSFKQ